MEHPKTIVPNKHDIYLGRWNKMKEPGIESGNTPGALSDIVKTLKSGLITKPYDIITKSAKDHTPSSKSPKTWICKNILKFVHKPTPELS